MTLTTIFLLFSLIGAVITGLRYLLCKTKPTNILLTWLQYSVGTFFIFSGFIKLIDPLGFSYKLSEYWEVFNMPFLKSISLAMSCFVTILEMLLGVTLILGYFRFWTTFLLLGMILFFLFLTWYSAYYNKVTDCGCFGDFMKLKPWNSFWKDVVLTIMILPLFIWYKKIDSIVNFKINTGLTAFSLLCFAGLQYYCYQHLPIIDFRPYKVGTNICEAKQIPEGAAEDVYISKFYYTNIKTNEVKEFDASNYPWRDTLNWKFTDRKSVLVQEGYKPPIHDFVLTDAQSNDVTDSLLNISGKHFFVIMYDVQKTEHEAVSKLNVLYNECKTKNISIVALASGSGAREYNTAHGLQMPLFECDGTALKTAIRSNPGLIQLEGCTVKQMWHHNDIPALSDIK